MGDDRPEHIHGESDKQQLINAWRTNVFSFDAWRRHLVWFAAAIALGLAAYWFYCCAHWSTDFLLWMWKNYPWAYWFMLPGGFMLVMYLRDHVFPGTEGTGIPQVIASLKMNGPMEKARDSVLSLKIAFGKVLLTTMGLFMGACIGREGPSVHVGASLMKVGMRFANFPQHLVKRGLILGGGAAGIASAFNAPIAGAVFAFEEIGRSFEKENAGTVARTVGLACIVVICFTGFYYFYGAVDTRMDTPMQWAAIPLIGVFLGLVGGGFSQALIFLIPRVSRLGKRSLRHSMGIAFVIGLSLVILAYLSDGQSLGSGFIDAQYFLFPEQVAETGLNLSPLYPVWRATASFITLLSGIPGGLFDPSLSAGAGVGNLVAPFFEQTCGCERQAIIMLCMVAFFTGVVQSPITSFTIMVEMTGATDMVLPMLATAMIAYEMSHLICPCSLYESLADAFLESQKAQA